jgi:N-acetylmuramic acid 6-phosphate etherase
MRARRVLDDAAFARLPTEASLPLSRDLDALSPEEVVSLLLSEEARSARAALKAARAIARAATHAYRALRQGGRLIYVGAGTSGRLAALDAAECPPTFGTRPGQVVAIVAGGSRALRRAVEGAEDRGDEARRALLALRVSQKDVVVAIAASGVTPFAWAALDLARERGVTTVLVTCSPRAVRGKIPVDVLIPLDVGPEVLAGSTRLKAGTATKLALNAISTAAMVALGKCYGSRMVDLRATSAKLRSRARRIVGELGKVAPREADRLLARARGNAKVAIVMARLGLSPRAAAARLTAAGGQLRRVIGPP